MASWIFCLDGGSSHPGRRLLTMVYKYRIASSISMTSKKPDLSMSTYNRGDVGVRRRAGWKHGWEEGIPFQSIGHR